MTITEVIITNAVSLLALIGVIVWAIKRKNSHVALKDDHNVTIVSRNASKKIFAIVAFFGVMPLIAVDTIVYWFRYINDFQFFAYFFLLLFVIAFATHYLINYYFDYVTFTDKKIVDHNFNKKPIEVNLSTIKSVEIKKTRVLILNKEDKIVASFYIDSYNANKLIDRLYNGFDVKVLDGILKYYQIPLKEVENTDKKEEKKNKKNSSNEANEITSDEDKKDVPSKTVNGTRYTESQVEAYTLIGKEFRENEKKNKIIDIVKIVLFEVLITAIVIGFILISHNLLMIILFGVNIFVGLSKAKEYKIKYSFFGNDDFDLGLKFAYLCPKVKGYNRLKMKQGKTSSMLLSIIAVIITAFNGYMTFTSKPITYDDTSLVENAVLVELKTDNHIDLKIKDLKNEYTDFIFTIPDSFYDYIEVENLKNEELNQNVTIRFTSKNNQATVLYLSIGDDVYVSQDTLDKHYNHYITNQRIIFYSLLGVTIAIIFGSLGYQLFLESQIKHECIDLNA